MNDPGRVTLASYSALAFRLDTTGGGTASTASALQIAAIGDVH